VSERERESRERERVGKRVCVEREVLEEKEEGREKRGRERPNPGF
jgi:hypothetical protein